VRYGEDTIEFANKYPQAKIYSLECNPNTPSECRANTARYPNIVLPEKAVSNMDGLVKFYAVNKEKTQTEWDDGNQGASSLFRASGKCPIEYMFTTKCW